MIAVLSLKMDQMSKYFCVSYCRLLTAPTQILMRMGRENRHFKERAGKYLLLAWEERGVSRDPKTSFMKIV